MVNPSQDKMMVEQQTINATASITAISWTGGKDCNLALVRAWRNGDMDVRFLLVFRLSTKPFQAHPIQFMEAQAHSLGLKLIFVDFSDEVSDWMDAYVTGIVRVRDMYGIKCIVTGDIDLVGTMQRNWMQRACERAQIKCHLPLWDISREEALNALFDEEFEIIFSCVKSPFFDATWINRKLDQKAMEDMKGIISQGLTKTQIDAGVKPLDLCGERGEYHTMCIFGPLYRHRVKMNIDPEPMKQEMDKTNWKGNIHNSTCIWAISLKIDKD